MIDPETGYQSNQIFCNTNHFSSYKLEIKSWTGCLYGHSNVVWPGSAPGKLQKNVHANTHLEHLTGKLSRKKNLCPDYLRLIFGI